MSLLRPALAFALLSSVALVPPDATGRSATSPVTTVRVAINDNRRPAGHLRDGVLTLHLDARLGEWHPDGDDASGAVVPAFAEEGGAPSIPGPLVRVPAGTVAALSIRNSLDQPLTLRGLHDRVSKTVPGTRDSAIVVAPGDSATLRIRLDVPGTYYYYGSTNGRTVDWRSGPDAQLGGAIVVDPPGARPKIDRVFVLGLWADTAGKVLMRRTRILAVVNGRSWPHTERLDYAVGDTVRFHVLNASSDSHPMHLHGFYFMVDGRGDGSSDTTYAPDRRRRVNTEDLLPGMTMTMTWVPERPGNWLFHCHLPDHFSARGSLGMPRDTRGDAMSAHHHAAMNHATTGMNGLVVGITVHGTAARTATVATRASRALRLLVRPSAGGSAEQPFYSFALDKDGVVPPADSGLHVGPPIVLTRDEPVRITVVNTLDVPTAVHWHGIELESYYDGVAGFSGVGQRLAPIIAPHDSFVVRFTPPRAGTFMYHTHVDETRQQLAGLAGPLIVLEPGRPFDPTVDHPVLITTPPEWSDELRSVLFNGSAAPPPMELRSGVAQRFRFINITTRRPNIHVELWRDSTLLSWRPLAKDGADLPATRQVAGPARSLVTIGDTRDFELVPEPGADLTLLVRAATGAVLIRQSLHVTDPRSSFQRLLDDHWQWVLRESPILATTLGDHRYDRQLGDLTVAAMDRRAREAAAFLSRANAIDTTSLTASERVSLAILRRGLSEDVEGNRFGQRTVLFTTYYGWHTGFADIGTTHPFRDRADYEAYVARLAAYPRYNRGAIETTRFALAGGFAQPCAPFAGYERTIAGVMDSTPEKSRFMEPFRRRPSNIPESDWTSLQSRAVAAVRDSVYPSYRALLDFYRTDYAPHCRSAAGISSTPNGAAYYAFRVRRETTTELTPEEVYQLGLREVARIGTEMDSVAKAAGYADRKAYVAHLRTDPAYYPKSADELLAAASVLTKRIDGEMPKYFGHLPRLPYTVKPIPDAVAPGVTAAYYGRGSLEGGRPGIYWVNTSKLDQRPYYELTSLTLHESVPGHHQQIAIAQELDLPIFRRYGTSFAAFTEGWGLYAERLGIEMGLYDTPEKQMGRLSYEMWRACRLVVDPAIHVKGWTREQAIEYMLAQTALSRGNVEAEVNRYITWPGQATAYKVGELRIRELRTRAEQQLGARFDLRGFNDAVLENGPVPLDVMEAQVKRWIAARPSS